MNTNLPHNADARLVGPHDNRSSGRYKPLQLAIGNEQFEAVEYLLKQGADVTMPFRPGCAPFWLATSTKSVALMKLLRSYIECRNDRGLTPLHAWSEKGELEIVKCLVDLGADIHASVHGDIALGIAARHGKLDVCCFLIEKGSYINYQGSDDETPLHAAAKEGNEALAEYQIGKGATIDLLDYEGNTRLLLATLDLHIDMVRLLHESNADINRSNHFDNTALHVAAMSTNLELVQYLLRHGADVHKANAEGDTAIGLVTRAMQYIARAPDPEAEAYEAPVEEYFEAAKIFDLLRQYGSSISRKNQKGIAVEEARISAQRTWETNFASKEIYFYK